MPRVPGRAFKGAVITTGNPDTVNDSYPSVTELAAYDLRGQLGQLHRSNDGSKEWVYARFSSTSTGATPAAGQPVFWHDIDARVVDNNTAASSASKSGLAGVLMNACTRGNLVWVRRKGVANVVSTSTVQVRGDLVYATGVAATGALTISTTSTVLGAAGLEGPGRFLGFVNSTTTSSITIDTLLDVE